MHKLLLLLAALSLFACSANPLEMGVTSKNPGGITFNNISRQKQSRAYQAAESHCAKYNKVPRVVKTIKQASNDDSIEQLSTTKFECVRPSN